MRKSNNINELDTQVNPVSNVKPKYFNRFSWSTIGLGGAVIAFTITNWRLVFTLACALAIMTVVYQYPRSFSPKQRLTWAVLAGSSSVLVCYFLLMLWQSYPNGWIGLAQISEFVAIFVTLGLVLYQNFRNKRSGETTDQLIIYLASADSLTRLIALRQLQQKAVNQSLSFQQEQQLKEYCQIILEQSHSPILADTALETIEYLQFTNVRPKLKHSRQELPLTSSQEVA